MAKVVAAKVIPRTTSRKMAARVEPEEIEEEEKETEEEENDKEPPTKAAPKPRLKKYNLAAVIHVLVEENPKRKGSGSHQRFELYTNGMTVQEALDEGITPADLDYDNKKEFIRIVG